MTRHSQPSMISSNSPHFINTTCTFTEILDAGLLSDQQIAYVTQFVNEIQAHSLSELVAHAHEYERIDDFMRDIAERAGFAWNMIEKRSAWHTALYYVFFKTIAPIYDCRSRFRSIPHFIDQFHNFTNEHQQEQQDLMKFANALDLISQFICPEHNKQVFIEIASRLASNFTERYVTGGGQKPATMRRVMLYETLFDIKPVKRTREHTIIDLDQLGDGDERRFHRFESGQQPTRRRRIPKYYATSSPISTTTSESSGTSVETMLSVQDDFDPMVNNSIDEPHLTEEEDWRSSLERGAVDPLADNGVVLTEDYWTKDNRCLGVDDFTELLFDVNGEPMDPFCLLVVDQCFEKLNECISVIYI